MAARLEIFGASIVALGSFTPVIFSPDWLERNNLVGSEDAEAARRGANFILARPVARMETDWFVMQVTEDQFLLTSNGPLAPHLKDLASGALSLVPQTPITALGLNFFGHYKFDTVDEYHRIGDVLVPKPIWLKLFSGDDRSAGLMNLDVVIQPAKRNETPKVKDRKQITVQPSAKIRHGIYLQYNDHHEIARQQDSPETPAETAALIVDEQWQRTWDESTRIFQALIDHALKTGT